MTWTRTIGIAAALLAVSGCVYVARPPRAPLFAVSSRPVASYYCADCHGLRYFDPYYDWCVGYGFRYRWSRHPEAIERYRERYVGIKELHPEFGRYRYSGGYRESRRYREPEDYERWRERPSSERSDDRLRERDRGERRREPPEKRRDKRPKRDEGKGPRSHGSRERGTQ